MKVSDFINAIEAFAAPELQEDYDNAGLITGSNQWECSGVLCTLDVTVETLDEAIANKCNLVVAHHPIIFRGLKKITGKNYVEQVIIKAIKNDIAIYAVHTNIDNVVLGVSGKIAEKLGLQNTRILAPKNKILRRLITFAPLADAARVRDAVFAAGAGHVGNYSECSFSTTGTGTFKAGEGADPYVGKQGERHEEPEAKVEVVYPFYLEKQVVKALIDHHPYEEVAYDIFTMDNVHFGIGAGIIGNLEHPMAEEKFLNIVKETFSLKLIRHTNLLHRDISKIAVCGGSGSFLTGAAIANKADVYLTADVKYHEFFDADGKILLADIGHYESEQFTIDLLHDLLEEKFPKFAVLKTKVNTNPVRYFL